MKPDKATRTEVNLAILSEIKYQDKMWNTKTTTSENRHSIEEWLQYMEVYINEAKIHLAHLARQDAHGPWTTCGRL